jgi:hypothetical protein
MCGCHLVSGHHRAGLRLEFGRRWRSWKCQRDRIAGSPVLNSYDHKVIECAMKGYRFLRQRLSKSTDLLPGFECRFFYAPARAALLCG